MSKAEPRCAWGHPQTRDPSSGSWSCGRVHLVIDGERAPEELIELQADLDLARRRYVSARSVALSPERRPVDPVQAGEEVEELARAYSRFIDARAEVDEATERWRVLRDAQRAVDGAGC